MAIRAFAWPAPYPATDDPLDVRGFGVTMNGTTDDTAGVTAAVAAAAASGQTLHWPYGTALTTASIPLLHTVEHRGPGRIKRGADLFSPSPASADTNHLYVAPAGVATNDGLSSAQPTTPQAAADALIVYGPALVGTWQIDFAAGSHSSIALADELIGNLRLVGVPTGDFRSTPTSVIDKALSGSSRNGVYFAGAGKRVLVKDIKAVDFISTTDAGFRAQSYCIVEMENCHTFNCYLGYYILDHAEYSVIGGMLDGNGKAGLYGVDELFGVVRSYRTAAVKANRTTVKGYQFGVHAKELCTGHFDFLQVTDCDYGIELTRFSTANLADMDFRRNGVGVAAVRAAIINNSDITWHGQRITAASWAAGTATFTFALDPYSRGVDVAIGERFDITDCAQAGYNGSFVALSASDTVLTAAMASNPGAWVSGGRIDANIIQILPIDQTVIDNVGTGGNLEAAILPPYLGQTSRLRSTFTVPFTLTGTTALTAIFYPMTGFLPGQFQAVGYEIRLYAAGTYTIANPATLFFRIGNSNLHFYTLPVGTAKNWVMEALLVITATGDFQYHCGTLAVDGQSMQVKRGAATFSLSTLEYNYGVWGQLTVGTDTITGEVGRLYTTNM